MRDIGSKDTTKSKEIASDYEIEKNIALRWLTFLFSRTAMTLEANGVSNKSA